MTQVQQLGWSLHCQFSNCNTANKNSTIFGRLVSFQTIHLSCLHNLQRKPEMSLVDCWSSLSRHQKIKKSKPLNRYSPESGKWIEINKLLAKIQVSTMFHKREMIYTKFIEFCMGTPCWCTSGWRSREWRWTVELATIFFISALPRRSEIPLVKKLLTRHKCLPYI